MNNPMTDPKTASGKEAAKAPWSTPSISSPKGGGAIRGIGEKFSVNAATGTASISVPLASSAGRSDFGPVFLLNYDSGSGNGPFGFGWNLSIPSITRKTDKGIPKYLDEDESDVFLLSGAEDLVPVLDSAGKRTVFERTLHNKAFSIHLYRPRTENLFARIERWTDNDTGLSHWRSITRDNVTTLFGTDENSQIIDPDDGRRVFSYLISLTFDDQGNATKYEYQPDDDRGIDVSASNEYNRSDGARRTQRYVKCVRYGNVQPYFPDWSEHGVAAAPPADWHFLVVFDYGDHPSPNPTLERNPEWPVRPDPFSRYRAGFEVRTYRRCARVLFYHNFPAESDVGAACLVRSTDFVYSDQVNSLDPTNPIYTFLESVTQTGYKKMLDGSFDQLSTPPLEFSYSQPVFSPDVVTVKDPESLNNLPEGIDGSRFRWVDLNGEGLSGILMEQDGGWGYKRNYSPINEVTLGNGERAIRARFGEMERVFSMPVPGNFRTQQFLDLTGNGRLDFATFDGPVPGYFERTEDEGWETLRTFRSLPQLNWSEPNLQFVDLNGDGLADVLITEHDVFTFHASLGGDGFAAAERVFCPRDEERGPHIVIADKTHTVSLADMTGDGLHDLVRVRNGEVCYWPNLGYGRFGRKVTMNASPHFTSEERFDPKRVRLADIDGSGTTDLVYIGEHGIHIFFNRSGNEWSSGTQLDVFPSYDQLETVQVVDLLGNGTACLVWSSPLANHARAPMRYVDLMGSRKPHLLTSVRNNYGAETRIAYAPSTRFYLEDKFAGHPWITRLPFPLHVVERVENYDWIGRSRFVARYTYHHGFFDGVEREFRGFGMVEQRDTQVHRHDTLFSEVGPLNEDASSFNPPVLTKTWFHTGAFFEEGQITKQFEHEYWTEPAMRGDDPAAESARRALFIPDSVMVDSDLTANELREAMRALKGSILRVEVYSEDESTHSKNPYAVTENNYSVIRLQSFGPNKHAVFRTSPRESASFHYERQDADPRISHEFTLETDDFGNVKRYASVAYPRRAGYPEPEPTLSAAFRGMLAHDQTRMHVAAAEHRYTDPVNRLTDAISFDVYRGRLGFETISAELTGFAPAGPLFRFEEIDAHYTTLWVGHDMAYEDVSTPDIEGMGAPVAYARRIVEHARTVYRSDDLTMLLPLGTAHPMALPGESYRLALTAGMLPRIFGARVTDAMLTEGGYVRLAGQNDWWIPSGRVFFSGGDADTPVQELAAARAHFFKIRRSIDPFGAVSRIEYDKYDLIPQSATDPVGNVTTDVIDYRVLQPRRVIDSNGNFTEVGFDCLGQITGTAVGGSAGEGDTLTEFNADLTEAQIQAVRADPLGAPATLLAKATARYVYDRLAFCRTRANPAPDPPLTYTLTRETHVSDLNGRTTGFRHVFLYADGFGREVQKKLQAKPDAAGPRWVASGWTVFNNKGLPVRKFEPFFTTSPGFELNHQAGVSSFTFYDPLGRAVAKLHPDSTFEKTVFDAWHEERWDLNDTVLIADPRMDVHVGDFFKRVLGNEPGAYTSWYNRRIGGFFGATANEQTANRDAALKAAAHTATPAFSHTDPLGRVCLNVANNGAERLPARTAMDTENKPLVSFDPVGRHAQEYCIREPLGAGFRYAASYDLIGNALYSNHIDAGEHRVLNDIMRNPIRSWDARGFVLTTKYDALRRPTHIYVGQPGYGEILAERMVYGESHPEADRNLKGKLFRHYDGAGVAQHDRYDFKGNLIKSGRQLAREATTLPDWAPLAHISDAVALDAAAAPLLVEHDVFTSSSRFDALNRIIQAVSAHRAHGLPSVIQPSYNEANQLDRIDVWIRQTSAPVKLLTPDTASLHAITNIEYDARGQRASIALGNGVTTLYTYDPETFRLLTLTTTRPNADPNARTVQALSYTYDPVGNITRLRDSADINNVVFFRNQRVDPTMDYSYEAIYRLSVATGREHLGQNSPQEITNDDFMRIGLDHPSDGNAMARYTERYIYDPAGNLTQMIHQLASGNWTRRYSYTDPSRITPNEMSNRLSATSAPGDNPRGPYSNTYSHDAQGNVTRMPHLPSITWDAHDRLQSTSRQVVNAGIPETTYYTYDARGTRIRKVSVRQTGLKKAERLYLGAFEIYREYAGDGVTMTLERETLTVSDDKQRVVVVETRTAGVTGLPQLVRYQFGNHLGSASLELDEAAAVISYEEYFPFGATSYQAVRGHTETPKRFRFNGKERDEESDLYYFGARYYAAWIGRWISCDPGRHGGNSYEYCDSNPTMLHDPDGSDGSFWDTFKPGGAVFEAADKVFNPTNPVAKGIMDNLDKRGEALIKAPGAMADLYHKEGAVGVAVTMAKGVGNLVKDTGEAAGDIAWEASHYEGPKSAEKIANRATDVVLNTADLVSIAAGGASAAKGGLAAVKAAPGVARSVATTVKEGMQTLEMGLKGMEPAAATVGGGVRAGAAGGTRALAVAGTAVKTGGSALNTAAGTTSMMTAGGKYAVNASKGSGASSGSSGGGSKTTPKASSKPKAKPQPPSRVTPGLMTETQFKDLMKGNIGVYVYRMVDESGNVLKWGTTENPFKRVYGYKGSGYAQMEVMGGPYARPQALSVETMEAETLGELGENIRGNTLEEMKGGGPWFGTVEIPRLENGRPMISLGVTK
jgi:RHS repeat-associated protein